MVKPTGRFRNPEDLSDSETEVHPNIEAKSFHRFMREERRRRLDELRAMPSLTPAEEKERADLEYRCLPVDAEVKEETSFCMASNSKKDVDYASCLVSLLENPTIDRFIAVLDTEDIDLRLFEEYVLMNLSSAIKDGDDEFGHALCRLGLLLNWASTYGRGYIMNIEKNGEDKLAEYYQTHYQMSKDAILGLRDNE